METTNLIGLEDTVSSVFLIDQKIDALKTQIKELEKRKKSSEDFLKERLKDADIGILEGWSVEYKRTPCHSLNQARLKEEEPDIYKRFTEESIRRRFTIKKTKEEEPSDFFFEG